MSEGRVSDQPLAFFASAIAGRHVGRSPGLVDKDQPSRIEAWLHCAPIGASGLDISPALLTALGIKVGRSAAGRFLQRLQLTFKKNSSRRRRIMFLYHLM